ncbi:phage baseplate assembly protein V [Caballeronia sp. LZ035]|uniref:phage baseplate assembly protein V n=1 Tax=Caballeronia sp. LZ035 TaxID=3038568 RepID=UPI002866543C|nr:phage baseplate assembly protein V [Caballeronia sp. LZ035]MDR5761452.1 phage baseplate assembly protein V [Caballeronia sp. LZ035]
MTLLAQTSPRETEVEAGGYVKGVAIAVVTQNKDPDHLCRVKVRYPWHEKPRESDWVRLAMPMAGKGRGFMAIPEVGDEVLVAFERGDLTQPYVLGVLWNGEDKPPGANDDGRNDQRRWVSRKRHYLSFDDGEHGVVELAHEKGRKVLIDDSGVSMEDEHGNQVTIDSDSGAMTIKASGDLTIQARNVRIEASGTLDLSAQTFLTVSGSQVKIN